MDSLAAVLNGPVLAAVAVVGGMMPALGFAILLRQLPMKKYGYFILLGFVLSAYMGVPVLGVSLIGLVAALLVFQNATAAPATAGVSLESKGDDDYEE